MVQEVTSRSEIPMSGSVVIDFFATWCGPCKRIAPVFESLAEKLSSRIVFLKVDVDEAPELLDLYDISAMPTFIFLKDGKLVRRVEGADLMALEEGFDLLTK